MTRDWCRVCCTDHPSERRCPGPLPTTGEEAEGWRVAVETPGGIQGFGTLLAPSGAYWRARIVTFPRTLWSVPGGGGAIKFLGRTAGEAELKAKAFIRQHCVSRGFVMRDELALPADDDPIVELRAGQSERRGTQEPRIRRQLRVRFGEERPILLGRTVNLSRSGIFIRTDEPIPTKRLVGLELELEHCKVPLRGSVVWLRRVPEENRPAGMGLRLLQPPAEYLSYIRALTC